MEVPPELPRPLKVAQAVVARHPGTRSLHDGIILTIKSSKYRVQFNRCVWQVVLDIHLQLRWFCDAPPWHPQLA
jgi:hypothetical protein